MLEAAFQQRIRTHTQVIEALADSAGIVQKICNLLIDTFKAGGRVWLAGNGGSAADAQHVAAELVVRLFHDRRCLPAVALPAGGAVGTAIGNDYSYEEVFSRQLEGLLQPGDVVWLFSTSGRSANIVKAAEVARRKGCPVVAFTGPKDSPLAERATLTLRGPGETTDLIQEAHEVAYHFICEHVEAAFLPGTTG